MTTPANDRPAKKVTILVAGEYNTGRSTMARQIEQHLNNIGLATLPYVDQDEAVPPTPEQQREVIAQLSEAIAAQRLQVEISTVSLQRHGLGTAPANAQGIEAIYQRGLLVTAVDRFLRQAGVISQKAPELTGADCLYQLEIYGEHLQARRQK